MSSLKPPDRVMYEYENLRSNNFFKQHETGRELFLKFRLNQISDGELSTISGRTNQQFSKLRSQLNGSKSEVDPEYIKKVNKRTKKIKEFQDHTKLVPESNTDEEEDSIRDAISMFRDLMLEVHSAAFYCIKQGRKVRDEKLINAGKGLASESKSMLTTWISSFGTLYDSAVAEVVEDQISQVQRLVDFVSTKHPEDLPEIVAQLEAGI